MLMLERALSQANVELTSPNGRTWADGSFSKSPKLACAGRQQIAKFRCSL